MHDSLSQAAGKRFAYLLVSLLVFFVITPFIVTTVYGVQVINIFFSIVLIINVYAIHLHRRYLVMAATLAALSITAHWASLFISDTFYLNIADTAISICFFLLTTSVVVRYVLEDPKVNAGTLLGAICAYLLLGLTWSLIYALIAIANPLAFTLPTALQANASPIFQYFIYYSFVTLTTLGYGDITPIGNVAKTFAWLEAVTGQLFLTVWIAQLVGKYISHSLLNRDKK